jgi:hypothetical protein
MRTLQRAGAALFALTLVGGVAACGDDSDSETTDTTAAAGDATTTTAASGAPAAFCDSLIEFNGLVFQIELDETSTEEDIKAAGDQLAPVFAPVAENAPEDLAATADDLNTAIQALQDGDADAFNADSTFDTYTGLVSGAIDACELDTVDVKAKDYAFEAPDTIDAGSVAFSFTNTSTAEDHEMALLQKADGVDLTWDELLNLPEEEARTKTKFVGATFAPPGGEGSTLATLEPGAYAMVCFIPVGSGEDGPPHFTQGMIHEFTVE